MTLAYDVFMTTLPHDHKMKIQKSSLMKPNSPQKISSKKISFSDSSSGGSGKLVKAGAIVGGSALVVAAILNPDKTGQIIDSIGSSIEPAMNLVAPIAAGVVQGGGVGMIAGVGYGMLATAGRTDSSPAFAAIGGAMGGVVVGGLVGGVAGAVGVNPLIAAPVVVAGAAVFHYMT